MKLASTKHIQWFCQKKPIIVRYAANHRIVNVIRQFLEDFSGSSLKESTICGWKKDYLKNCLHGKMWQRYEDREATAKENC